MDDDEEIRPRRRRTRDEDDAPRTARKTTAVRRRAEEDDDEDEVVVPRSRRSAEVVEDDEEEKPRSKRPASRDEDEDDEDEKPRRRARSRDEDDDEDAEDEDEEPRNASIAKAGWGAAKKNTTSGDFANEFKFDDGVETLVKFLDDEPFASYKEHWIERKGKKSFMCLGSNACPLCKVGDIARGKTAFNIAVLSGDEVEVQALVCGPRLLKQIETLHKGKNGPLTTHYWSLTRTGKKSETSYPMQVVKARDLEDWDLEEDDILKDLKGLKLYTADIFKPMSKSALKEVADEIE